MNNPPLPPRADSDTPPSKTRRKNAMHALQDLGELLVQLDPARLNQIELPESLVDAVVAARGITKWEARRRQMQYIGRLMRDVDPEPIRAQFARWDGSSAQETARLHNLERRREQLLTEPQALDALCAQYPTLDRPHWRNLIQRAKEEQANGLPPKSYRQIFRELRELAGEASDTPGQDNPES